MVASERPRDDRGAAVGDLDPVPVAPDARVGVEVRLAVLGAVLVAPEVDRHRRHRLGQHELADLADVGVAFGVPRFDRRAERARLQLALVHRQLGHAADERRAQVGAAAGGEQPGVLADVLVDPAEALGGERGAGGADGLQRAQVAALGRLDLTLHARADVARARPERGHLGARGEVPQRVERRVAGGAVVEEDRGFGQQPGDEEVPHHPAGRGEPEQAVAPLRVHVQMQHLQVLEQDAALGLDDRLRQPGRAGAVEHPQRMVEGDAVERERLVGRGPVVLAEDHRLRGGHRRGDLGQRLAAVELAAAVAVAAHGEQHLRLDLGEAVDHRARAEIG